MSSPRSLFFLSSSICMSSFSSKPSTTVSSVKFVSGIESKEISVVLGVAAFSSISSCIDFSIRHYS